MAMAKSKWSPLQKVPRWVSLPCYSFLVLWLAVSLAFVILSVCSVMLVNLKNAKAGVAPEQADVSTSIWRRILPSLGAASTSTVTLGQNPQLGGGNPGGMAAPGGIDGTSGASTGAAAGATGAGAGAGVGVGGVNGVGAGGFQGNAGATDGVSGVAGGVQGQGGGGAGMGRPFISQLNTGVGATGQGQVEGGHVEVVQGNPFHMAVGGSAARAAAEASHGASGLFGAQALGGQGGAMGNQNENVGQMGQMGQMGQQGQMGQNGQMGQMGQNFQMGQNGQMGQMGQNGQMGMQGQMGNGGMGQNGNMGMNGNMGNQQGILQTGAGMAGMQGTTVGGAAMGAAAGAGAGGVGVGGGMQGGGASGYGVGGGAGSGLTGAGGSAMSGGIQGVQGAGAGAGTGTDGVQGNADAALFLQSGLSSMLRENGGDAGGRTSVSGVAGGAGAGGGAEGMSGAAGGASSLAQGGGGVGGTPGMGMASSLVGATAGGAGAGAGRASAGGANEGGSELGLVDKFEILGSKLTPGEQVVAFRKRWECLTSLRENTWAYNATPRLLPWPAEDPFLQCEEKDGYLGQRSNGKVKWGTYTEDNWPVAESLKYVWTRKTPGACGADEPSFTQFDAPGFCDALRRAKGPLYIAGDVISAHFFLSLAAQAETFGVPVKQLDLTPACKEFMTDVKARGAEPTYKDKWPPCLQYLFCGDTLATGGVLVQFSVSVYLSGIDPAYKISEEVLWGEEIDTYKPAVVVLNRGAHYVKNHYFIPQLNYTLHELRKKLPNSLIVFRSTAQGHPDCADHVKPLDEPYHPKSWPWNWNKYPEQNAFAKEIVESVGGVYLNIQPMTLLRPDWHTKTCLHYCLPGPVDDWVKIFAKMLEELV